MLWFSISILSNLIKKRKIKNKAQVFFSQAMHNNGLKNRPFPNNHGCKWQVFTLLLLADPVFKIQINLNLLKVSGRQ